MFEKAGKFCADWRDRTGARKRKSLATARASPPARPQQRGHIPSQPEIRAPHPAQATKTAIQCIKKHMAGTRTPLVINAETIDGDLIITFSNGDSALYSAEHLLSLLDQETAFPFELIASAGYASPARDTAQ
jgi:hypothetical protein